VSERQIRVTILFLAGVLAGLLLGWSLAR